MAASRILLCGDVKGKVRLLAKRISAVSKTNGPFDSLFCVGQFFPDVGKDIDEISELIEGKLELPIPTYFVGDYGASASAILSVAKSKSSLGSEEVFLCKNLIWLKGSGILNVQGLRIAYLAGKYVPSIYADAAGAQCNGAYHEDDVDALRAFADEPKVVDLFLSNEWPKGIVNGVSAPPELNPSFVGSSIVAELAAELKPRYHISGTETFFFARDPYLNEGSTVTTRFVGLADVGNEKKQKFLHALSLTPASSMSKDELAHRPPNTTKSPFTSSLSNDVKPNPKPSDSVHDAEGQYWRYSAPQSKRQKSGDGHADKVCFEFAFKGSCSRGNSCNFEHNQSNAKLPKGACFDFFTKGKCERGSECKFRHSAEEHKTKFSDGGSASLPAPCWFCLASPDVDTNLVITVGDHCYCAMAKGGLVDGHVLLLPIEHFPSTITLPKDAMAEIHRYKSVLRRLYKSQGKAMIVFERYLQLKAGTHAHLQIIPIPFSKASQIRSGFVSGARDLGFTFDVIRPDEDANIEEDLEKHLRGGRNYFYVELPEGTILAHVLDAKESIPMQFGREVCAKVLGIPERSDWRVCKSTKDEEKIATEKFRGEFSAFE